MKRLPIQKGTLAVLAVIVPLLVLFAYVALRSGPLAPVAVVLAPVDQQSITPSLFGIGTIESRYTHRIGPTMPGRLMRLDVDVGDHVKAGDLLGVMDPVDLDERINAQEALLKRSEAQLQEAQVRKEYAAAQAQRYEQLFAARATTEELLETRQHELRLATVGMAAAREEIARIGAEREALLAQRRNLALTAPVDGLVVARLADPGTTMVTGQAVVEVVDPAALWVNVRFDQIKTRGLAANLPASVTLRSQTDWPLAGSVLRVEPLADAITEETLAKVVFATTPEPLPPIGELVEVTVTLPPLPATAVIPNAAIQVVGGRLGVWRFAASALQFVPVVGGDSDLEGRMQIRSGLEPGDQIVVYSENPLNRRSRIRVVEQIAGSRP